MKKSNKIEEYLNRLKEEITEYDYYKIERKVCISILSMSVMEVKNIMKEDLNTFGMFNDSIDFQMNSFRLYLGYNTDGKLYYTDRLRNRACLSRKEFIGLVEFIMGLIDYTQIED